MRLQGSEIPIFGRIMGVVDSYDAMTCARPYAQSRSPHQAVNELYRLRGTLFQAELVEQFIQNCGIYPTGSLVELSNGQVGGGHRRAQPQAPAPERDAAAGRRQAAVAAVPVLDLGEVEEDDAGQPLTVKGGLPTGAYGIDPVELFLD